MKKLLLVIEHFEMRNSGAENDAIQLCLGLLERGYDLTVCCNDGKAIDNVKLYSPCSKAQEVAKLINPDYIIDWAFTGEADIYRVGGAIHEAYLKYYILSFHPLLRWIKKIELALKPKHRNAIALEKKLLAQPNAKYSVISSLVQKQFIERNIHIDRAIVAHNGVNLQKFQRGSLATRQKIRDSWQIKPDDFVAIFVSHNLRLKNLPLLIRVFDLLTKQGHNMKLVVCGKHSPLVKRKYLIYAGVTPHLEDFYTAADILLHPTFYDAFGNILPEAIACGLPAIVSDATGAAELIKPNEKAYRVLPTSNMWQKSGTELWAKTILQIKEQYPLLQNEIAQKRVFLEKNFSLKHFIDQFELLLK